MGEQRHWWRLYYGKHIDFILPWVCSGIYHRWHQNMIRTPVTHFCSHHILLRFKGEQGWKTSWKHTVFIYTYIFFLSSGSVGAGSAAVAVAAAQAVTTTLQMQPGRRASGALKPPYAAALGGCTDFWSLLFSWTGTFAIRSKFHVLSRGSWHNFYRKEIGEFVNV